MFTNICGRPMGHDVLAKIKTQTARAARAPGVTTTLHLVAETTGHVAGRIAEIADDTAADLIVVETRGLTGWMRSSP
jgi:nucleotide-binding universal stress UspA family protein